MDKTLIIVFDDFSERIFEYSNVTVFDYGFLSTAKAFDTIENGYGTDVLTNDRVEVVFQDTVGGFYEVSPDDFQYSRGSDIDVIDTTTTVDGNGDQVIEYTYTFFDRDSESAEGKPGHGDWVVESIMQSLEFPENTDILAIDVDLNEAGFIIASHFNRAFEFRTFEINGVEYTEPGLVKAYFDFLELYDSVLNPQADNTYLASALSVSIVGLTVSENQIDTLNYFESLNVPIFQSAPNTTQAEFVPWKSVYENVITVGAWNRYQDGTLGFAALTSVEFVDLVGDGYVARDGWGEDFGTSFATPRVAAEFTNRANDILEGLNSQGITLSDFEQSNFIPPQFVELVDMAVPELSTRVIATFENTELGEATINVSSAAIANNGLIPLELPFINRSGLPGSQLSSVRLASEATGPTEGPDVIVGGSDADSISALGGNDTITGGGANDEINGGGGVDTAVYSGSQNSYALILSPDATTLIDRRADGNGTDTLTSIEFIDFDTDAFGGPYQLYLGMSGLSAAAFESFIELYIAYFNRAPDANGLNFWGTAFANGTSLELMATFFIDQVEFRSTYPSGTSNEAFATAVYNNVLGRTPDQDGIDFWVGALDSGNVTRDQFILDALRGAKSELKPELGQDFVDQQLADRAYLENKVDIGALYAVHYGMSDVANAVAAMALYDGSSSSIDDAVNQIGTYYDAALDPTNGEFLIQVTGVLDSPFFT